jgi:adenylate kinase family enzyme
MLIFKPCFENWLLCHFEKQKSKNISCNQNEETLKKYIPNYEKNDCKLLEKYISKELVLFAVENEKFYGEIFKKYYLITTL